MTYTTDHKWRDIRYDADGYAYVVYRGIRYGLNEFVRTGDVYPDCPIKAHGNYQGSAFHSIMIELSVDGDRYRACMARA